MKMYLPPRGQKSSRRSFLKRGIVGGALLALGGASWLAFKQSATVAVPTGLRVFTPREYAVIAAIAARVIPPRSGWPSVEKMGVAAACDSISARTDETAQGELKQLLMLFENALSGFVFGFRTVPFTLLSPEEQDVVLHEWATSAVSLRRSGYNALHTLVTAAYFGQKECWPLVGYPGPPPGIHDPAAPVWKGGGQPRPPSNGSWLAAPAVAAPEAPAPDAGTPPDGGTP